MAFVPFTLLEGMFTSISTGLERLLTILLIVVPAGLGTLAGLFSFSRTPRQVILSFLAVILNGLTFLFYAFVSGFAG
jgi:hypothetical protein